MTGAHRSWQRRCRGRYPDDHGQDLGDGVEQFFRPGNRSTRVWTIRAQHVPQLAAALGAGDDLWRRPLRFSDERPPSNHFRRAGDPLRPLVASATEACKGARFPSSHVRPDGFSKRTAGLQAGR